MKKIGLIENLPGVRDLRQSDLPSQSLEAVFRAAGGNTGNIAYVAGAHSLLNEEFIPIDWSTPNDMILENCRSVIVCCANQLGSHADLGGWAEKLRSLALPVTLLGLGAQANEQNERVAIPEGTKRFLGVVANLRTNPSKPNIAVRGEFTKNVLNSYQHDCEDIGCPSLFINPDPELGKKVAEAAARDDNRPVAVSAGNPYLVKSIKAELQLCRFALNNSSPYIVQHPKKMLQLAMHCRSQMSSEDVELIRSRTALDLDTSSFLRWCAESWLLFLDARAWMTAVADCSFVIGARYHGVALGIQAGVPACVVTVDARTEELASFTKIPIAQLSEVSNTTDMKQFRSRCDRAWGEQFDANRLFLSKKWQEFLRAQEIKASPLLLEKFG